MNYKRFSRFFCLAAAFCVILAGAAAPLTAYAAEDDGAAALDVAQETRTLSGTWRWNDVLTVPDFWSSDSSGVDVPLSFVVPFDIPPVLEDEFSGSFSYLLFYSAQDSFAIAYGFPSDEALPMPVYSVAEGRFWNFLAEFFTGLTGSDASFLNGYGQTITLTRAQEVPVEFYDWFTANAVKQVSPMETFLDNFTAPISGIWSVVTDVSTTIASTPLLLLAFCFAFLGLCVSIFGRILSRS